MNLYLIQWGSIDKQKKSIKFQIEKQDHVWAANKDAARAWGITQDARKIVKAEEVYAVIVYPEYKVYQVVMGKEL